MEVNSKVNFGYRNDEPANGRENGNSTYHENTRSKADTNIAESKAKDTQLHVNDVTHGAIDDDTNENDSKGIDYIMDTIVGYGGSPLPFLVKFPFFLWENISFLRIP